MDKKFIEDAYRKLKGSVYWDKTVPFLRMEIAEYERENVEKKIEAINENLHDEVKWENFKTDILSTITVLTFPKSIEDKADNADMGEPVVISNISRTDAEVQIEKYNNFIDMSVEGHILGVLWILTIGYKMDNSLDKNCYGNRLNDNLVFENQKPTASPNLFKPYFAQYETWRNRGLKEAENVINKQRKSVIITMLDLTRYYYNVQITNQVFTDMTGSFYDNEDDVLNRINYFVYDVIKTYSELCECKNSYMLPIGFLPSSIISNYYLKETDEKIKQSKDAVYYGRYVDDMILVTEFNDTDAFKENNQNVCRYMLELLEQSAILNRNDNGEYSLNGFQTLKFQKDKFRFFYIDKDGYDSIIGKIQDDICKNASEFNYIPETAIEEPGSDILKIEREDTVNKLRAVNKVTVDKYELSKVVGKNIMMSKFADDKEMVIKFAKNLEQILNHKEILNNYTLWESILNYYVINDYIDGISFLSKTICSAIEHMKENNKCDEYEYLNNSQIKQVGDSLIYYYFACLTRATAISWGLDVQQVIEESIEMFLHISEYDEYKQLFTLKNIKQIRKLYCSSRMINKNLLPVNVENCMTAFKLDDFESKQKIYSLEAYLQSNLQCRFRKINQKYAPYIQTPFEILYSVLIDQIRDGKEELFSDQKCVEILCKKYANNFGNTKGTYIESYIEAASYGEENCIIKINNNNNNNKNSKVKIAVANVRMEEKDIYDIFEENMRDVSQRCQDIGKILNEAIRYKADILVFPEAYIPIEYLKMLQAKAAAHNMIIIGGIEHIKHGNLIYNLTATILPIKNEKMSYAIPFFHQKLYFSPHELEMVKKYGCKPAMGQKHTLFKWGGIFFATYCCYELTSVELRHTFQGDADIIFGVEWNKDTYYFGNIMEALSRDIYCYCVQICLSMGIAGLYNRPRRIL